MAQRALIGANVRVEVQKTLASAKVVESITNANPAVVTSTAHGFLEGDIIVLAIEEGMLELNGVAARVANPDANTFELESIDSTEFQASAANSGNVAQKVTAWDLVGWCREVNLPNAAAADIDTTTLADVQSQVEYGMLGAQAGTIEGLFQPNAVSMDNMRAASRAKANRVFRITWPGGTRAIFNAALSAGLGFTQGMNAAATTSVPVSVKGFPSFFAS